MTPTHKLEQRGRPQTNVGRSAAHVSQMWIHGSVTAADISINLLVNEPRIVNHKQSAVLERETLTSTEIGPQALRGVAPQ